MRIKNSPTKKYKNLSSLMLREMSNPCYIPGVLIDLYHQCSISWGFSRGRRWTEWIYIERTFLRLCCMTESGQSNLTRGPRNYSPHEAWHFRSPSPPSSKELEVFGVLLSAVYIGSPRKLNSASREGTQQQKQSRWIFQREPRHADIK